MMVPKDLQRLSRSFISFLNYALIVSSGLFINTIAIFPSYSLELVRIGKQTPTGFSQVSGITYSGAGNTYYGISDDSTPKFYTITIDLNGNVLNSVSKTATTILKDSSGNALSNIDAEGIALSGSNIFVSTEGNFTALNPVLYDQSTLTSPTNLFINRFNISTGNQDSSAGSVTSLRSRYTVEGSTTTGLRNNLAFESLTISPDQTRLFSAVESSLKEDLPLSSLLGGSTPLLRLLQFDQSGSAYSSGAEYLYNAQPNYGLVDLLALNNNTLLALERNPNSLATSLFEISIGGATDISANSGLGGSTAGITPVTKTAITFDIPLTNVTNYEGLTFGQILPDGRPTVVFVSDNNNTDATSTSFEVYAAVPFDFSPNLGLFGLGAIYAGNRLIKKLKK